jgi:hypothetical protein
MTTERLGSVKSRIVVEDDSLKGTFSGHQINDETDPATSTTPETPLPTNVTQTLSPAVEPTAAGMPKLTLPDTQPVPTVNLNGTIQGMPARELAIAPGAQPIDKPTVRNDRPFNTKEVKILDELALATARAAVVVEPTTVEKSDAASGIENQSSDRMLRIIADLRDKLNTALAELGSAKLENEKSNQLIADLRAELEAKDFQIKQLAYDLNLEIGKFDFLRRTADGYHTALEAIPKATSPDLGAVPKETSLKIDFNRFPWIVRKFVGLFRKL